MPRKQTSAHNWAEWVAFIALLVAATACGASTGREVRSDVPRAAPQPESLAGGVAAVNAFAVDLQRVLAGRGGNTAVATYPLARALAMARVGADGSTKAALDQALHAELSDDLDRGFAALDQSLAGRSGQQRNATRQGDVEIMLPSILWAQEETRFTLDFLDPLSRYYGTGVRVVDFRSESNEARDAINRWAETETDGTVDLLVPRGEVTDFTRFVVASAGAVRAPWAVRFDPTDTRNAPFELIDGRSVDATTMHLRDAGTVRSASGDDWLAVELPYLGGELAMLMLVPNAGEFDHIASTVDADQVDSITGALVPRPLDLRVPRFQFSSVLNLDADLTTLGLGDAFSTQLADFSRITGDESLAISDVVHGTYVAVDEEGTDGDAVTVVPSGDALTPGAAVVEINRPFLFFVRDTTSGLILQIGRVLEPQT